MKRYERFSRGMGIGGWLTNYKRFHVLPKERQLDITVGDLEHFRTYITERDIAYIASLGMDHIRLGFDQIVVEEAPFVYRAEIVGLLHHFVDWCHKYGLRPVLNLHKALGNYCDIPDQVGLVRDEGLRERFVALWGMLESEFSSDGDVFFELLNETVDASAAEWNEFLRKTIADLRPFNPNRVFIVGGVDWNSPSGLSALDLPDDPHLVCTFHCYAPHLFTHQQGVLSPDNCYYNRKVPYPSSDLSYYRDYFALLGKPDEFAGYDRVDIGYLRDYLRPAIGFAEAHPNLCVWCGEFGTIRHIKPEYRENYMNDVIRILCENGIPYSVWNYISTPNDGNRFSLVDDDERKILSDRMAAIIRGDVR